MAVIVKYIVVRNGVEKMTFATKKEADAHDKMLDIADHLFSFFEKEKVSLNEQQIEEMSLLLAEKRDDVMPLLRGINPVKAKPKPKSVKPKEKVPSQENPEDKKIAVAPSKVKAAAKKATHVAKKV